MATDADFSTAVDFVIREEIGAFPNGGLHTDPNDPGGTTKWGISQRDHPDVDVADLSRDDAVGIYYTDYWQASGADRLPMPLAQVVLDTAANQGVTAAKQLVVASGGDVNQYLALRAQRYLTTAENNPGLARYLPDWLTRLEHLSSAIGPPGVSVAIVGLVLVGLGILALNGQLPSGHRPKRARLP